MTIPMQFCKMLIYSPHSISSNLIVIIKCEHVSQWVYIYVLSVQSDILKGCTPLTFTLNLQQIRLIINCLRVTFNCSILSQFLVYNKLDQKHFDLTEKIEAMRKLNILILKVMRTLNIIIKAMRPLNIIIKAMRTLIGYHNKSYENIEYFNFKSYEKIEYFNFKSMKTLNIIIKAIRL